MKLLKKILTLFIFLLILVLFYKYSDLLHLIANRIVKWGLIHRKLFLIGLAGIGENFPSLITLGSILRNEKIIVFFYYCIICSITAFITDVTMFFFLKLTPVTSVVEKYKESSIVYFIQKYQILTIVLYRFVPFARIPTLSMAGAIVPAKLFIFFNMVGALLWSFFHVFLGYNNFFRSIWEFILSYLIYFLFSASLVTTTQLPLFIRCYKLIKNIFLKPKN